jgi:predicted amidophosphoribosyltransferase
LRGLGRRQRAQALAGAFKVGDKQRRLAEGRSIILVDDVFTSGATASGCARALKRAGAAQVNILAWARVVGRPDLTSPQVART